MRLLIIALFLSGCSHWTPVKRCMDTVDRETQERTEY